MKSCSTGKIFDYFCTCNTTVAQNIQNTEYEYILVRITGDRISSISKKLVTSVQDTKAKVSPSPAVQYFGTVVYESISVPFCSIKHDEIEHCILLLQCFFFQHALPSVNLVYSPGLICATTCFGRVYPPAVYYHDKLIVHDSRTFCTLGIKLLLCYGFHIFRCRIRTIGKDVHMPQAVSHLSSVTLYDCFCDKSRSWQLQLAN